MNSDILRLGTRGSELALKQAHLVEAALRAAHPGLQVEQKIINTLGDKRPDLRFKEFTDGERLDKGIFTKELEHALQNDVIDIAVHSLKDVPTVLDDAFCIAAVLPRAPIEDVLVSLAGWTLDSLPDGARVGTSSVRRARQIRWLRPGVHCVEIRGNVPTRVKKLLAGDLDAVLLAKAGLVRLGFIAAGSGKEPNGSGVRPVLLDGLTFAGAELPSERFHPAAGQGAIGIEARRADSATLHRLDAINDTATFARVCAEREFLHLLQAGCQTPIGAHTWIEGTTLHFSAWVFDEDDADAAPRQVNAAGAVETPLAVAAAAADQLLKN